MGEISSHPTVSPAPPPSGFGLLPHDDEVMSDSKKRSKCDAKTSRARNQINDARSARRLRARVPPTLGLQLKVSRCCCCFGFFLLFFWLGWGGGSWQTAVDLTAGMPLRPGMWPSLHVAHGSPHSPPPPPPSMTGLIVGTPEEGLCQTLRGFGGGGNWNPAVHLQTAASVAPPSARVRSALLALDVAFSSLRTRSRAASTCLKCTVWWRLFPPFTRQ